MSTKHPIRRKPKTEHEHQILFFDFVRINMRKFEPLRWIHHVPNGMFIADDSRRVTIGMEYKRLGVIKGIPDIFFPYPSRGYDGLFIEMKKPGGSMSDEQADFESYITRYTNYKHIVCYSYENAIDALKKYVLSVEWTDIEVEK